MLSYIILVLLLADFNVESADKTITQVYHPHVSLNYENILFSPCTLPQVCNAGNTIGLGILLHQLASHRNESCLVCVGLLLLLQSGEVELNPGPLTGTCVFSCTCTVYVKSLWCTCMYMYLYLLNFKLVFILCINFKQNQLLSEFVQQCLCAPSSMVVNVITELLTST